MGTEVIDKLRITGSAASLRDPTLRRSVGYHGNGDLVDSATPTFTFVQDGESSSKGKKTHNTPSLSHPNSAPCLKKSYLQRVQEANRGLTSMDSRPHNVPNNPGIGTTPNTTSTTNGNGLHFLLRGKPVNGELDLDTTGTHKRVGHYKTSSSESYRARHRFRDKADFKAYSNCPVPSPIQNDAFFYLGPYASPAFDQNQNQNNLPTSRDIMAMPAFLPGAISHGNQDNAFRPFSDKEAVSSNTHHNAMIGHENRSVVSSGSFDQPRCFEEGRNGPHPRQTPASSHKRRQTTTASKTRIPNHNVPGVLPDSKLLTQCLQVQQSHNMDTKKSEDGYKVGDPNNFSNRTNPSSHYHNTKSFRGQNKLGSSKNQNTRYLFNSVNSYVHFNKIYPANGNGGNGSSGSGGRPDHTTPLGVSKLAHGVVPRLEAFSPHCTDTLLLKMMFEMNRPPPRSSVISAGNKYSDVAVHKDLEEFVVVSGAPSVSMSRSTSHSSMMHSPPGVGAPGPPPQSDSIKAPPPTTEDPDNDAAVDKDDGNNDDNNFGNDDNTLDNDENTVDKDDGNNDDNNFGNDDNTIDNDENNVDNDDNTVDKDDDGDGVAAAP